MSLVTTGHHVPAAITRLLAGDPLILRAQWGDRAIRHVVYAMVDQLDDTPVPVSKRRTGHANQADWFVWPKSGKVKDQGLYAFRCSEDEATTALVGLSATKGVK
jgi:hypothetical protein